ncbi:uncharacterized protein LOC115450208 [Manduca sexta]|uniref:Uncharacterized protein n=1 Tax=Manduca sexta TaxID=7130 RepID=A0A921ZNK9_MANSE|nr:uncharacterized protein LOC115450208 [Manduca sexta]KAG6460494.1 hypothetical protein O3G_MSEX012011 [Manduca sexta]
MTILLYDYCELEERTNRRLKVWKVWHLLLFAFAAVFGIANYVFLQNAMELVDNNCILFPRELEFRMVDLSEFQFQMNELNETTLNGGNITETAQAGDAVPNSSENAKITAKRDTNNGVVHTLEASTVYINTTGNKTHHLMLDTSRTLFEENTACQFAEYMPILSTIFAAVWMTLFTMCPGGGHARTGLPQPWRILAPALLFSLVMVGLTGHSFTTTNRGLHAFCEAFFELTNTTTCSSVNSYLERGWNVSWGIGGRIAATRAASAAVWASWACAAALFLARCLAAPDFQVKRIGVYVTQDPQRKITPYLKKSPRNRKRSNNSSPTKRDNLSVKSEPTITTELVTVSVEHGQDSVPTSLMATPVKSQRNSDLIEMTYNPQERIQEE